MVEVTLEDCQRIDIRAGAVVRCEPFPEPPNPASKLWIDLGPETVVLVAPDRRAPDGSRLG